MKKLKNCPLCGSSKIHFLYKNQDKNLGSKGSFNQDLCEICNCIFLNPQPEKKEVLGFYPKDKYYSLQRIDKGSKANLKIELCKTYFGGGNQLKKILFSPISFLARGAKMKKGLKVLDIGSGSGQFLYEMKKFGLDVYGLEPGEFNRDETKKEGLKIENKPLEKTKYKKESFDLITLNHVLEHLENPGLALSKIKSLLKKDGLFIVAVPNSRSLAHFLFRKNWYQLDTPRHLINYSDKNLNRTLKKSGFRILRVRYNSRPSQFSVSFRYLFGFKGKSIDKILDVIFLPLTWIVNALKLGDQIEIWCEKAH
ncbi:MAG: class I SAM-dependent methyltransferase [archaeon]|nr:class I SAM-dependent methyltransferase [archaeon]